MYDITNVYYKVSCYSKRKLEEDRGSYGLELKDLKSNPRHLKYVKKEGKIQVLTSEIIILNWHYSLIPWPEVVLAIMSSRKKSLFWLLQT